jgi:5'-AMP-activated protein kinase regulatory gamma subunit
MQEKRVSGAAVVMKDGRIIADITNGDLRTLTREHFSVLALPVAEFIALTHGTSYSGYAAGVAEDESRVQSGFSSAFFEKSRAFRREQYEHERRRALAVDPRRTDLLSSIPPAGVFTVDLDACFRYEWFSKLNKQRVYIVSKTNDAPFDVITLTDALECATFGRVHQGAHRHR